MITVDGRTLLSRADLHEQYGYATSALERWWAERETNGHPPAHRHAGALYWDAEEWAAWNRRRTTAPTGWSTRDQLADEHGVSRSTLDRLWKERARNGHPEPTRYGGVMHWDSAAWGRWYAELQRRTAAQAAPLPHSPRGGTPHEEIGPSEFARILTHKDNSWVSKAAITPPPGFPEPDSWGDPEARKRPRWKRHRAEEYARTRHTAPRPRGRRAGSTNTQPYPYAGDPRLTLARQVLADHPDERTARLIERLAELSDQPASPSTWTKIITTARRHPEP